MPSVLMPDGVTVELPDNPKPEQLSQLSAIRDKITTSQAPPSKIERGLKYWGEVGKGIGTEIGKMRENVARVSQPGFKQTPEEEQQAIKSFESATQNIAGVGVMKVAGQSIKEIVGRAVSEKTPQSMFTSVAKWSGTLKTDVQKEFNKTLMKWNLPFNIEGVQKMGSLIQSKIDKIESMITDTYIGESSKLQTAVSQATRKPLEGVSRVTEGAKTTISEAQPLQRQVGQVTQPTGMTSVGLESGIKTKFEINPKIEVRMDNVLNTAKENVSKMPEAFLNNAGREAAINKEIAAWKREKGITPSGNIDLLKAQELKKEADRELDAFFKAKDTVAVQPRLKAKAIAINAIRDGLKKDIERLVPGIKEENQALGELLTVQPHYIKAVNRIEKYDPVTVSEWLTTLTGHAIAGNMGAVGAFGAKKFLGAPGARSEIALALEKWRQSAKAKDIPMWMKTEGETSKLSEVP